MGRGGEGGGREGRGEEGRGEGSGGNQGGGEEGKGTKGKGKRKERGWEGRGGGKGWRGERRGGSPRIRPPGGQGPTHSMSSTQSTGQAGLDHLRPHLAKMRTSFQPNALVMDHIVSPKFPH